MLFTTRISDHYITKIVVGFFVETDNIEKFVMKIDQTKYNKKAFQAFIMDDTGWDSNNVTDTNILADRLVGGIMYALDIICSKNKIKINKKQDQKKN